MAYGGNWGENYWYQESNVWDQPILRQYVPRRILDARVVQGSGNRSLDKLAELIASRAAPFGAFTSAMRQDTDQFDVTARFRFTREQTLETTLQADPLAGATVQELK